MTLGPYTVAREFFDRALTLARDRHERRAIAERLCELAEASDFHEYRELHGPSPVDPEPA